MNQAEFDQKQIDLTNAINALAQRIANLPPPPPTDFTSEGATTDTQITAVNQIAP